VFADTFRIIQGGIDRPGTRRVEIMLVDMLNRIQLIECIQRIVISVTVIDGACSIKIEGEGTVGFFEFMPESKIGAIDVDA